MSGVVQFDPVAAVEDALLRALPPSVGPIRAVLIAGAVASWLHESRDEPLTRARIAALGAALEPITIKSKERLHDLSR